MKKAILFFSFIAIFSTLTNAQDIKYGWKIGFNAGGNSGVGVNVDKGLGKSFDLNLKRSKQDYSVGIWGSVKLAKFYVSPEVMFNTFAIEYKLVGPTIKGLDTVKTDRFYRLDVPLMLGYRAGKTVFIKAGPSVHFSLGGKSDLTSIEGFVAKYKPVQFGYQFGVAFAMSKKTQLEFRFNRFLDNYGDHIYIDDKQYTFSKPFKHMFIGLTFAL